MVITNQDTYAEVLCTRIEGDDFEIDPRGTFRIHHALTKPYSIHLGKRFMSEVIQKSKALQVPKGCVNIVNIT